MTIVTLGLHLKTKIKGLINAEETVVKHLYLKVFLYPVQDSIEVTLKCFFIFLETCFVGTGMCALL